MTEAEDPWTATVQAATEVAHDFHLLGVLFNAAVDQPEVTGVYELRSGGHFRQQTLSTHRAHGDIRTRQVQSSTLLTVLAPIPRALPDRLRAALALYDYSLTGLHPHRMLEAGLRLYPGIENLTEHVINVMQAEAGYSAENHARSLGIDMTRDDWRYQYRGTIRRERIFTSDPASFRTMREARNDYEHASVDMDSIRRRIEAVLPSLYSQVRTALLAALPLDPAALAVVTRPPFDTPLANWPTQVVGNGTFAGPDAAFTFDAPRLEFDLDLGHAGFVETDFDPAAGVRHGQLTYTINGKAGDLPDGVSGRITKTEAFSPNDLGVPTTPMQTKTKQVLFNGEVVTAQVIRPSEDPDDSADR